MPETSQVQNDRCNMLEEVEPTQLNFATRRSASAIRDIGDLSDSTCNGVGGYVIGVVRCIETRSRLVKKREDDDDGEEEEGKKRRKRSSDIKEGMLLGAIGEWRHWVY